MTVKEVAATLFIEQKQPHDAIALVLRMLSQIKPTDYAQVYELYEQCKNHQIEIVQVKHVGELTKQLRIQIEECIMQQVSGEYIPLFTQDEALLGGFQLIIGDRLVDFSLLSKVMKAV